MRKVIEKVYQYAPFPVAIIFGSPQGYAPIFINISKIANQYSEHKYTWVDMRRTDGHADGQINKLRFRNRFGIDRYNERTWSHRYAQTYYILYHKWRRVQKCTIIILRNYRIENRMQIMRINGMAWIQRRGRVPCKRCQATSGYCNNRLNDWNSYSSCHVYVWMYVYRYI